MAKRSFKCVRFKDMVYGILADAMQAYVTDQVSTVVTPNQSLEGFKKVNIPSVTQIVLPSMHPDMMFLLYSKGQTVDVSISIPIQQLQVWTSSNKFVVEPGVFDIKIGSSSAAVLQSNFTVV